MALVAAVAGTAFAATGLNSKQKKEVKKIARSVANPGPAGSAGAAGLNGAAGPEGAPWTTGGTLPSGQTETGTWGSYFTKEGVATISFPIPLAAPLGAGQVKRVDIGDPTPAQCDDGSGEAGSGANPEADPGFLCVFGTFAENEGAILAGGLVDPSTIESGAGKIGATVLLTSKSVNTALLIGTFAVTAP
ncbi:MAG TPA: hypothetical protein VMS60_06870 [Solirubrobacterales bacterium]|nr:hypothetical protein [Solirubrobacterales bacterium]